MVKGRNLSTSVPAVRLPSLRYPDVPTRVVPLLLQRLPSGG